MQKDTRNYTDELVNKVVAAFIEVEQIEKNYRLKKAEVMSELINREVPLCEKCLRPMLPRRLWDRIPVEQRSGLFTKMGNERMCAPHWQREKEKSGKKLLSDSELERLRRTVGLI